MSILRIIFSVFCLLLYVHALYFAVFDADNAVDTCFFRRDVEWVPVRHDKAVSIDEIKRAE